MYKFLNRKTIGIATVSQMRDLATIIDSHVNNGSLFFEEGLSLVMCYHAGLITEQNCKDWQVQYCKTTNAKNGFIQVTMVVKAVRGDIYHGALMYLSAEAYRNASTSLRHAHVRHSAASKTKK